MISHPFADQWNELTRHYPKIAELVADYHTILDMGCGEGLLAKHLGAKGHEVIGVDRDPAVLSEDCPGAHFVLADATNLPFADASFDAVVCCDMLTQTNAGRALVEMRRLVKPGGRVVIIGRAKAKTLAEKLAGLEHLSKQIQLGIGKTAWVSKTTEYPAELGFAETAAFLADYLPGVEFSRVGAKNYLAIWQQNG